MIFFRAVHGHIHSFQGFFRTSFFSVFSDSLDARDGCYFETFGAGAGAAGTVAAGAVAAGAVAVGAVAAGGAAVEQARWDEGEFRRSL